MSNYAVRFSSLVLLGLSTPALANIEEVIVSSQKRDQAIEEIPFAISAISGDKLTALNIADLRDINALSPGLYISNDDPTRSSYTVRGITSGEPSAQAAPRVAVYLDDVDISRNRSSQIELYDMERIEIIKGPQSTLFGTTASAGAIAYYTNRPSPETKSELSASFGNYGLFDVRAMANGGNDTIQGRLAMLSRQRDGYAGNLDSAGADFGSLDRFSMRPSLRWVINDAWTSDFSFTYETGGDTITPNKSGLIAPVGGETSPFSGLSISGSPEVSAIFPRNSLTIDRTARNSNLTIDGALNNWHLKSITSYRDFESSTPFDADGSQAYAFELLEQASGQQFSQELRAQFIEDNSIITAALSYVDEGNRRSNSFSADEGSYIMCVPVARQAFSAIYNQFATLSPSVAQLAAIVDPTTGLPCNNPDGSINSLTPIQTNGALQTLPYFARLDDYAYNQSLSALLDWAYDINDSLHIDAGIRYIEEDRRSEYSAISPTAVLLQNLLPLLTIGDTGGTRISAEDDDSELLIRLNASYQWQDNHYAYASYSEGRKSVVVSVLSVLDNNFLPRESINRIPAEKLENFEVGFKGRTASLQYSAALFYQNYKNFQISFLDGSGQFITTNAGDTSNPGAELEFSWDMTDTLNIFGNLGVIDRTLDSDARNGLFAGNALQQASETTGTLGFKHQATIGKTSINTTLYAHYRSEFATDPQNQPNEPFSGLPLTQEAYTLVNGSVQLSKPAENWAVTLWGQNLTDEEYLSDISDIGASIGLPTYSAAPPRTWGLTVSIRQ